MLDTNLDLLDTDIPRKYFACLHNEDVSGVTFFLPRRLEDVKLLTRRRVEVDFKTYLEDVLKTSSRLTNVCWVVSIDLNTSSLASVPLIIVSDFECQ